MIRSLVLSLDDVWMLIVQVFVICIGMFVVHTLVASEVNHNARSLDGVVNGLYVSCYYAGVAFGAWLIGYIHELFGWTLFLIALAAIAPLDDCFMWLYGQIHQTRRR
ncbi:MAG: hypothetical protein VX915_00780 [Pseudomonadota bacterium]|nr:hypothetical protein [Pseudomonadota bacterium]